MPARKIYYFIFFVPVIFIACQSIQSKMPNHLEYQLVKEWPQLPPGFVLGSPTGIGIDTSQNVFIFCRAGREWPLFSSMPKAPISSKTILILDRNSGKILNSWGNDLFIMPHGLIVDKDNNVWVTDVGLHQVFKFTHDGKLLMKLGEARVSGNDHSHFNLPTDIAVTPDGSFYVSDGYGNSRVVKFSAAGEYLFEWGRKGSGDGEFNIPHAIDLDDKGNVYVADRENKRIQVFDASGKFLKQWTDNSFGKICSVVFDKKEKRIIAVDDANSWFGLKHNGSDIILFDSLGNVTAKFGKGILKAEGTKCWYHDVAVDDQQNIYVGDILGNRIQKFRKINK